MEIHELSLKEINSGLRGGLFSMEEVINHFKERIARLDPQINAFIEPDYFEQPGTIDFNSSEIAGVPFAVKDNLALAGHAVSAGSNILKGYKAPYTATVLKKLLEADGVALGRVNCDEFAMGSSTETSAYGATKNPWDTERVPGGSSGGSAAAVAAGLVPYAIASDTGGSIRQPASLCGIVGLKPTYGRVSRYGLLALASSLDVIGCFTRSVGDAATVLQYLAGHDPLDSTSVNKAVPRYADSYQKGVAGLRIGIPKEYFGAGLQPGVEAAVRNAIAKLEELGAEIVEVSLPSSQYGLAAYYVILPVEASANLSRYDGVKYGLSAGGVAETRGQGFGAEVKRRIMLGAYASSSGYYDAYYKQAIAVQSHIRQEFKEVFESVDCIASPVAPGTAFKLGEKTDDPLSMYMEDVLAVPANIAGIPGISIPCGFDKGLPTGLQIMAPWFREDVLFQVGGAYESATDWSKQKPKVW